MKIDPAKISEMSNHNPDYFSNKITFLNVILTFSIVILHAKTPERWGMALDMSFPYIYWTHVIVQIGVPCFFFISGMLFYRKCNDFNDIERKLLSRVNTLLIPYIVWNVFFVAVYYLMTRIPDIHSRMNMGEVFISPKEILTAIILSKFTVLWFVEDLMIFCALSALIYIVIKRKKTSFCVFGISVAAVLIYKPEYQSVYYWFPMYLSGAMMGRFIVDTRDGQYWDIKSAIGKNYSIAVAVVMVLVFVITAILTGYDAESFIFWFRLLSPVLIWFTVDVFLRRFIEVKFRKKAWMTYMFFIFCTHQFVLNLLQKIVVLNLPPTHLVLNLTFIITPVIAMIVLIFIARFLSRYPIFRYLNGGR